MDRSAKTSTRILCLGNPLLADDAFGLIVAGRLRERRPDLDIRESSTSGFDLLDYTLGAGRLIVVDTVQSGTLAPGTISVFQEEDVRTAPGDSPHYVGLFEALRLGRALHLDVPREVTIIAVEPADCLTLGGAMHPAVSAAIHEALRLIEARIQCKPGRSDAPGCSSCS